MVIGYLEEIHLCQPDIKPRFEIAVTLLFLIMRKFIRVMMARMNMQLLRNSIS
jgi:hypothetical protein